MKPVALFRVRDAAGIDDKVVCVPPHDPGWPAAEDLADLPPQLRREIERFFSVYKELEGKAVEIDGWDDAAAARKTMAAARRREAG